ncbi:uracil-DNA glycosylase family protein [Bowmanella sp. Y26]|uniref:uracil-DNA glycosylase family protein n=1 Tax=Bowmanella yangjiangensis TaxID=2811230 RepID=UPI001BDD7372|nr:uracil-DNA glycosylase family protein [Bowmanella yangjiangensis]MBT1066132.1 uracil-DNA glycosylase family protein [Bowmanella yangjiangensis]
MTIIQKGGCLKDKTITVLQEIRQCRLCEPELPLGANPVVRGAEHARLVIIGQAPGTKVHQSSIPWNDASGERLREWLQLPSEKFYDQHQVAIMPMGFCYPGKGKSGDLPPRKECAPTWHQRLLDTLPERRLTLLIGQYAQQYYLQDKLTLTERLKNYRQYLPEYFVLPHPSPRNNIWLKRNPWFADTLLEDLQQRVKAVLAKDHTSY